MSAPARARARTGAKAAPTAGQKARAKAGSKAGSKAAAKAGSREATSPGSRRPKNKNKATARRPAVRPVRAFVPVAGAVVWVVALVGALVGSSLLTCVVMIPVAVLATVSATRAADAATRRRARRRPSLPQLAAVGAGVVVPLAALLGPAAGTAILLLAVVGITILVVGASFAASARPLSAVAPALVAALAPTVATTCVVIARSQGSTLALALVAATLAFDCGSFVMGHGRTAIGGRFGLIFGVASVAVVAVFAAALMDPPFSGNRPWVIFVAVAVFAPLGVRLCQLPAGGSRLPALRRLDSLSLTAPVWVVAAALLLHR